MLEILIPGWKSLRHSRLGLVWITCGWARAAIIGKCVCACACVSVCVCVCVCGGELERSTRRTEIAPWTSL